MMKEKLIKTVLLLATVQLAGCDLAETVAPCAGGQCRAPEEFISEIEALGMTISTDERPLAESVDVQRVTQEEDGEEFIFSNSLELYISPRDGFEEVANPDTIENDWSDHPYVYGFSVENDGIFEMIKPYNQFSPGFFLPLEGTLFGPLHVTNEPEELVRFGNHILEAVSMIPVRASHIDLWFKSERDQEYTLVSRIPLSSMLAWRKYLEPQL